MGDLPKNLWLGIQWMQDKQTDGNWRDIRQNRNVHTFYWIQEGRGTFVTDSFPDMKVEAGMLFYLKPGLKLSMESDAGAPLRITMVLLNLMTVQPENLPFAASVPELDLPFVTVVEGERKRQFDALFKNLTGGWVPGRPAGELRELAILYQLLYELVQVPYSNAAAETGSDIFRRIQSELEQDFAQEIRLKERAALHGISVSYLRELFHRYLGISPKAYLDQVRNEHAKKRLIYTDQPVRDIGASCGYADEYHFSKRFKQANGMPPLQFRKRNRQ